MSRLRHTQKTQRPRLAGRLLAACLLLNLLLTGIAQAQVLLLPSYTSQPYLPVVSALLDQLNESELVINSLPADALTVAKAREQKLLISIGTRALRLALEHGGETPILALMVPRRAFDSLTGTAEGQQALQSGRLSALWLEQPYARQLKLARLLRPSARRLGVLLGPVSREEKALLRQATAQTDWRLTTTELDTNDSPLREIGRLVQSSDLLLAVPDQADFNRTTAKWLLLLSLRESIPLIGYSKRYVEAGAAAAVYSSTESIAREAARWIQQLNRQPMPQLPPPQYPEDFSISLNANLLMRLGLEPIDEGVLESALREEELP